VTHSKFGKNIWWLLGVLALMAGTALGSPGNSVFQQEQLKVRYNLALGPAERGQVLALSDEFATDAPPGFAASSSHKSPGKAFLLSLAVPGLGQYYYGSRVKPFIFLGAEVTAWALYFHYHGEGERITDEFEAFNRAHWSQQRYEDYLFYVYGVTSDTLVPPGTTEVSHHLPDDLTQQYYEMTGKYDQFAWGWDDARLDGADLTSTVEAITSSATTPYSSRRFYYEGIRNDANNNFDNATRMVFFSMANRVISAFEALFTTRSINKKSRAEENTFGDIKIKARLKSYYAYSDTPYITATFKF
jgi:hypothetical protein